jgi:uncharacterized protein with HEPN domain
MDREQVIATLREHESELKAAGVVRLSLFGSTARGDGGPNSDVDLLAAFDDTMPISLLDVAGIASRPRFCVPSKDPVQRFADILENIEMIESFTEGMSLASFRSDPRTTNAVERCLEQISEAARKLDRCADEISPDIPWPKLRALGNLLRHEYDTVDQGRVWIMVQQDLPPLKAAVQAALQRLRRDRGEW